MSAMSRTKGQSGEREVSAIVRALTGWDVGCRVRQHGGDSDLEGSGGDDLGNIRSLIDVNLKALKNRGYDESVITFDAGSGTFRDSDGQEMARASIDDLADFTGLGREANAGGTTLARGAILAAISREERGTGAAGGRRDGLLAELARIRSDSPEATHKIFYSRSSAQFSRAEPLNALRSFSRQDIRDRLADSFGSAGQKGWWWRHMSAGQQAAIVASAQDWAKAQTQGGDRRSDQGEALHLETAKQPADFWPGHEWAAETTADGRAEVAMGLSRDGARMQTPPSSCSGLLRSPASEACQNLSPP